MVTEETVVVVPEHVSYTRVDDAIVILNIQTGRIFHLDEVGTRMWELLQNYAGTGLEPIMTALLDEYEVSRDRLWTELTQFIGKLEEKG
jgi:hypothetical protein